MHHGLYGRKSTFSAYALQTLAWYGYKELKLVPKMISDYASP